MNAPTETISLKIGDGTLIVPAEGLARVWLGQQFGARSDGPALAIGANLAGQKYAGLTIHNNVPHRLFLLPDEAEAGTWQKVTEWAAKQGGGDCVLPSRIDALVLFQNLKDEFKPAWYWTSEPYAARADYAWLQLFNYGSQDVYRTSNHYRARAVRRVPI